MSIPALPNYYEMKWINEDGTLSRDASLYMDDLAQTLELMLLVINLTTLTQTIGNPDTIQVNGIVAPSKSTAEITALESSASVGTIWFDTNIKKLKVKTDAGIIETISSS